MRINKLLALLVFVLLIPTCASAAFDLGDFISPQEGRTYPYSAGMIIQMDDAVLPAGVSNCSYVLTWYGDNSTHGDWWAYPEFNYDRINFTDSTDMTDGGYKFDLDFDGKYMLNNTCWDGADIYYQEVTFYVDRAELGDSKPLTAIILVIGILSIAWLLHFLSSELDDRHSALKLYLLLLQIFIVAIGVFSFGSVHREFIKTNILGTSIDTAIYVFMIGVIVVTIVYFIIHLFKVIAEKMHFKNVRRDNDFE